MSQRIYRINIDDYNESNSPKNVFINAQLDHKIIDAEVAHKYNVCIEKAEISISSVPMFLNKDDLYVNFYTGINTFYQRKNITGDFYTIPELLHAVSNALKVIHVSSPTPFDFGTFRWDPDTELIIWEIKKESAEQIVTIDTVWCEISPKLQFFLANLGGIITNSGQVAVDARFTGSGAPAVSKVTQTRSTRSRFYQMKAIRIFCPSLSTNPYYLYDQSKRTLVKTSMLSEIVLNSEMMSSDLANVIYIPTVFRWSELLQSSTNVQNLLVYAMVHYATGDDIPLQQLPGEYTSITLAFEKLDQ